MPYAAELPDRRAGTVDREPVLEGRIEKDLRVGLMHRAGVVEKPIAAHEQPPVLDARSEPVEVQKALRPLDVGVYGEAVDRVVLRRDVEVPSVDFVVWLVNVDEHVAEIGVALQNPVAGFKCVVGEPHQPALEVPPFHAGLDRGVVAGNAVMGEDAVAPVEERSVLQGVLVAVRLIVERIAGRLIEAAKRKYAEALVAERSFDLRAAIERPDIRRIEYEVWDR